MHFQELSQILMEYFDNKTVVLDFHVSRSLQSLKPWQLPYSLFIHLFPAAKS